MQREQRKSRQGKPWQLPKMQASTGRGVGNVFSKGGRLHGKEYVSGF